MTPRPSNPRSPERTARRRALSPARAVALAGAATAFAIAACSASEEVKFGGPNALSNIKTPPTPGASTSTPATDAGGGGGGCADDGSCTTKWKTDVYPILKSTGAWGCARTDCHGGSTPAAQPAISDTDPNAAYAALRAHTGTRAKPYIGCTGAVADSPFICNVTNGPESCGSVMPKWPDGGRGAAGTLELQKLDSWIKCGAPNN